MSVKGSDLYISECCIYNSICIRIFVKLFRELNIVIMDFWLYSHLFGGVNRGSTVVKVLCYKSKGRWIDPSWCQWIFH